MIAKRRLDYLLLIEALSNSAELAKAFAVIVKLRTEAGKIDGARMADYRLGLICHALRLFISKRPPNWADMHKLTFYQTIALFLASVCCRQLEQLNHAWSKRGDT